MQPVFAYRPEGYPPQGRIWPQFGDDVLEETLSISEGARQSLSRKRGNMNDFHAENLQYHGLAPRDIAVPEDEDLPIAPPPPEGHGGQAPMSRHPGQMEPMAPGPAGFPPGSTGTGMGSSLNPM